MNRTIRTSCLFIFAALSWAGTCQAQSLLQPAGLDPGDEYRVLFITAGTRDATSTDIEDYNAFVDAQADQNGSLLQSLLTDFRVVGSTATVDARDNTDVNNGLADVPIYLIDGSLFEASNMDLYSMGFGPVGSMLLDQFGSAQDEGESFFTGSQSDGVGGAVPLGNLISGGAAVGRFGNLNQTLIIKSDSLRFVGVSGVLTVVPEPSTVTLLGLFGMAGFVRRARRDMIS